MLTFFDYVILAVVGFSGLFGVFRGFFHEFISLIVSIIALACAFYSAPFVANLFKFLHVPWAQRVLAVVVVFFIIYLTLSILFKHFTLRFSKENIFLGATDKGLGFIYGALRGVVLCSLAQWFFVFLVPAPQNQPMWMKSAHFLPILQRTHKALEEIYNGLAQIPFVQDTFKTTSGDENVSAPKAPPANQNEIIEPTPQVSQEDIATPAPKTADEKAEQKSLSIETPSTATPLPEERHEKQKVVAPSAVTSSKANKPVVSADQEELLEATKEAVIAQPKKASATQEVSQKKKSATPSVAPLEGLQQEVEKRLLESLEEQNPILKKMDLRKTKKSNK